MLTKILSVILHSIHLNKPIYLLRLHPALCNACTFIFHFIAKNSRKICGQCNNNQCMDPVKAQMGTLWIKPVASSKEVKRT